MVKIISVLLLSFLIYVGCSSSPTRKALPGTQASSSVKEYKIVLDADNLSVTVSYSPLYADNELYSTRLSQKGDCLIIRSDYLNSIALYYDGKELCDNADTDKDKWCGTENVSIFVDSKGVFIDKKTSTSSYDNCDTFLTSELSRKVENLQDCINKLPRDLNQEEDMRRSKDCTKEARDK